MAHILRLAAAALCVAFASPSVLANSTGVIGTTNKSGGSGCNGCHGAAGGNMASVAITGPASLTAGQAGTYTVTATQVTGSAGVKMGVNVAASDSPTPLSVFAGMPTGLSSGEIHHNSAVGALRTTSGGTATYQFTYTMPAAAAVGSTHTLYAASTLAFTGWNHAPNFTVTTAPVNPTSVTPSNITQATVDLTWTGGGPQYRVVYKTGAVAPTTPTDGTTINLAAVTSTTVAGLTGGTQYTFKIFSKDAGATVFSASGPTTTITTLATTAGTRYVNASAGSNAGNCSSAGLPCRTITYAMAQATSGNPGDLISVAPGTYNVALGEVFPIIFKPGVQLVATGTPSNTIIDGTGDTVRQGLIFSTGNASPVARIEGFTIANGLHIPSQGGSATGGGVRIQTSSQTFTITRNVFSNNEARGYSADNSTGMTGGLGWGGGLYVFSSAMNVVNNVFVGNIARGGNGFSHPGTPLTGNEYGGPGEGGAIYIGGTGIVINNTFYGNAAIGGNGGSSSTGTANGREGSKGAISASGNPAPSIANNIFMNNSASSGTGGTPDISSIGAVLAGNAPSVRNNLFFGNTVSGAASAGDTIGVSSVSANPNFLAAPTSFNIPVGSPAAGTGSATAAPTVDLAGTTRATPPAIGAYEPGNPNPPRLANISTRGLVGTGNNVMIAGLIVGGPSAKTVVITVAGPSLSGAGIPNPLANPHLTLIRSSDGVTVGASDNWGDAANAAAIQSAGFAPAHPAEPAIMMTLAPGAYTAIVQGSAGIGTGVALVGVYEIDHPEVPLINLSTRGQVLNGSDVMIAGLIIYGDGPQQVVITVAGPSLVNAGIPNPIANPTLTLIRSSDGVVVGSNDNWGDAANAAAIQAAGFAPAHAAEPAIMMTLAPGAYTAIVQGSGGQSTGIGLVGVYKVN
ncbi:choice-of-anchor V domain-containing protein [Usitatibacter palustris]|uniref:Fibronectin type-III domain-containing protein n=1 Tax=Usitatibacter palustris TaxID=2732487 RepID=A0A6M4H9T5_9PROT|nr:choice-of-anchor V domain-containing protein [Usitatibacter palustris]QJR16529.1 hypothetical protein DSM104440_03364 [Usitatibacter palustris]